nr:unnamed protein product [Callosobruchus analis]
MPPGQEVMDILIVDEVPHTCSAEALDDYKDKEVTTDMPSTSKTTGSICKTPVKEKDLDNPDVPSVQESKYKTLSVYHVSKNKSLVLHETSVNAPTKSQSKLQHKRFGSIFKRREKKLLEVINPCSEYICELQTAKAKLDSFNDNSIHLKTPMSKKLRLNRGSTKSMKDKFYEKKICLRKRKLKGAN